LASSPTAELLAEVARAGAETLGLSLAGAPAAVQARAAAQAGPGTLAEVVLAAAGRGPPEAERQRARQSVAAAAAVTDGAGVSPTQVVGLSAIARGLATEPSSAVRAVAQRLPRALGQILLAQHLCLVDMGDCT
jgi:hypothetical protein